MNDYWRGDWRNNPMVKRSRNPELKKLAMNQIRYFVNRGDSIERIITLHCGIMGRYGHIEGAKTSTATGHYLIPGSKTDSGVRCGIRQIGALIEYDDGRVEWGVFKFEDIYNELKNGTKPVQLELGL